VQVAHTCNPSYLGGRDLEDVQNQPQANSLGDPILENQTNKQIKKSQKRAGGVAQGVGPEFKPQYHKKIK
jgi:hypothetical protein